MAQVARISAAMQSQAPSPPVALKPYTLGELMQKNVVETGP